MRFTRIRQTVTRATLLVTAAAAVGLLAVAPPAGAADVAKTMSPNGPLTTVTTTVAGANARVSFSGIAGQVVNVATSAGSFATNCSAQLAVLKPDGATVQAGPVCGGIAGAINNVAISVSGLYQVLVNPNGNLVGTVKVNITSSSVTKSVTPSAPPVRVSVPANGTVNLGFLSAQPKFIAARVAAGTYPSACNLKLTLVKPNNTNLAAPTCVGTGTPFIDALAAASSGVYKVRLISSVGTAGSVKVQVWTATNVAGTITPGASPILVKTTTPGQNANYTFNGTAGQAMTADLGGSTIASGSLQLLRPNGTLLTSRVFGSGATFVDNLTLDATGSWTVRINPSQQTIGRVNLAIDFVTIGNDTIVVDGPPKIATIGAAGDTVTWTFSGANGQIVTNTYSNSTIQSGGFVIKRPNGSVFVSQPFNSFGGFIDPITLDATGAWSLIIDPDATFTGSVTVELKSVTDQTGAMSLGVAKTTTIVQGGQRALYSFTGATGQQLTTTLSASTMVSGLLHFQRPDGTILVSHFFGLNLSFKDAVVLDAAGTWRVIVDPDGGVTGSLTHLIDEVVDQTGTISIGVPKTTTINTAGQRALYTFSGTFGQRIASTITSSTISAGLLLIQRPTGVPLAAQSLGIPGFKDPVVLDSTGTWTIVIDPDQAQTGSVTFRIDAVVDQVGTIALGPPGVVANIDQAGKRAVFSFVGTTGQNRVVQFSASTITSGSVSLLRPNGSTAASCGLTNGAANCVAFALDSIGTWKVLLDPTGTATGTATLTLT